MSFTDSESFGLESAELEISIGLRSSSYFAWREYQTNTIHDVYYLEKQENLDSSSNFSFPGLDKHEHEHKHEIHKDFPNPAYLKKYIA